MQKFLDYISTWPVPRVLITALFFILFFGVIDYVTGPDLSVFIFYLIPVFFGTWFVGRWAGVALSVLSAFAWTIADKISTSSIVPYWNLFMEVAFFLLVTQVLTVMKRSFEYEKLIARIDYLTGAFNSRYFTELLEMELNRMRRYLRPFTAVYMDVDNFKKLNDSFGHGAGDELLRLAVKTMRDCVRSTDIVARIGGDEFMLLFPETGSDTARQALEKVRNQLLLLASERSWPVTFSFGMVTFNTPPQSVDQVIKLADNLMYKGKNNGKNLILHEVFDAGRTFTV